MRVHNQVAFAPVTEQEFPDKIEVHIAKTVFIKLLDAYQTGTSTYMTLRMRTGRYL